METVLAERLDAIAAQRVFRVLMDTMARPGTVATLDRSPRWPSALLPLLCLADVETSFHLVCADDVVRGAVAQATGARLAPLAVADFVVALGPMDAGVVGTLNIGTANAPERGARVVLACDSLREADDVGDGSDDAVCLRLSGPGIKGASTQLVVGGTDAAVFAAIAKANAAFPAGIDVFCVTPEGRVAAVPRSCRLSIEGER